MVMLNKLGSGAGGIVKKGLHIPSMVVTAVKRIKVFQHSQLKQMARELRTLYSCSAATEISGKGKCPHVVSFFGAYTNRADSTISIVLEYMDAGSLQDLINANVCMDEGESPFKPLHNVSVMACVFRQVKAGFSPFYSSFL